ncbi:unnamed protein product [marine sediment metagenome]|uniref:Uncharacterized protein n=1 Tax=marine sediment metagenome TaxID=412755 RepID=X1G697_9ZZZZ
MITTQKVNKLVMWGYDASCPHKKLDNNMARAQFIVTLQPSYNQQIQNYYKIKISLRIIFKKEGIIL